jgi:hypothetical protein
LAKAEPSRLCRPVGMYWGWEGGWGGYGKGTRLFCFGDMRGVGGFERRDEAADGGLSGTLIGCLPPPESTVNGPFLPPDVVRQGSLSIFPDALATPGLTSCSRGAGLGRIGRSLLVVLAELVEVGDDFDEVVERGDGPAKGGEGVFCEMVAAAGVMGLQRVSESEGVAIKGRGERWRIGVCRAAGSRRS